MATSLQRQLAALATPSSALLIPDRKVSSILFTPQEAARHKRDFFYELGCDGLYELIKVNPALFKKFLTGPLFNESSKRFERIVEDKEANEKLDAFLEEFLISLSPYLMLKAAVKCLEWLVNRFHIEKFNVDLIMECIIPYFDTKTFTLVIQVLEVDKTSNAWQWILPNVKTALPLSKPDLYAQCNSKFIVWIFSTFYKYVDYHEPRPENLRVFIAFMTSLFSGVLNRLSTDLQNIDKPRQHLKHENRAKAMISCLWSQLAKLSTNIKTHEQLKSNEEIQSMIYIVSTVLFNTVSVNQELRIAEKKPDIRKLMGNILKNHPRALKTQAYLLLNLLSSVRESKIKLNKRVQLRRALEEIAVLSSDWDLWHLSSKLILDHVLQDEFRFAMNKLWDILTRINFTIPQRSELLKSLYLKMCRSGTSKPFLKGKKKFLTRFEREYPMEFELACNGDPKFSSRLAKVTRGKNFILLAQHPSVEIRLEAVKKLIRNFKGRHFQRTKTKAQPSVKTSKHGKKPTPKLKPKNVEKLKAVVPDTNKTAKALFPRFKDESYEVVHLLIKQDITLLSKMFSVTTLLEQLSDIIERKECSQACLRTAVPQFCRVAEIIQLNPDLWKILGSKIFTTLVPLLFPTTPFKLKLCLAALSSEFAKKNSFLKEYSKLTVNENVSTQELCDFSYDALTTSSKAEQFCQNWDPDSSTLTVNKVAAVFAILLWNSTSRFSDLMAWIETIVFKPFSTSWCLNKRSFPKCLQQAWKKGSIPLELVLTTLFRLNVADANEVERVVAFALRNCEKLENRNICAGFLKAYLNKHFSKETSQLRFWISMIVNANKKNVGPSSSWKEFILIRVLQLLSLTLKDCSTRKTKVDQKLNSEIVEVILTQCLDQDSPRVRLWGLNCLDVFAELGNSKDSQFTSFITGYRGEIIADKEQVPVVITKALQMDEFHEIRDRFIKVIMEESVEGIIGTGLLKMFRFASFSIFTQFFPIATELLQSDPNSKKLLAILNCFDGSLTPSSFEILIEALKHKDSCLVMLSKMTPAVFDTYEEITKKKLIALLIDTVLFSKVPEIKVIIQRRVRKWILDANIISAELDKCIRLEKLLSSGGNAIARKSLKRKTSETVSHSVFGDVEWTNRTEVVLEFVQNRKRLQQRSKLILPLFKLLKTCISLEEQSPVEYLKQLILTTLTLCCCEEDVKEKANMEDWIHFNVETVIDCLRCSRNPQTHHHALILLNYAARKYPEQVLHGVMSLFTFMGNSILRQDDSYSTQLIQQTVTTIIPTLANETSARQFSKNLVSAGIFRVFTSAVQDIPTHRRLPVFISLVETLDPRETMWQACIIIIDNALTRDKKRSHLNADMELATNIVWHFDANNVIASLARIYEYLMDLPIFERNFTEEMFARVKSNQEPHSKAILDLSRKETLRDAEIIVLFTVELLSKICDKFADLEGHKELIYDSLLQKCLSMARLVASNQEDRIIRLIGLRNMEVIEKINVALDPPEFIRVSTAILLSDDNIVKKKMLDLLNQRILHQMEWFKNPSVLLELIPRLVKLGSSIPETEDQVTLVQTSLLSLKLIGRHLAVLHPEEFVPVFELANEHTRHKNKLLRASGLLCLGELFSLKSLVLPKLADVCSSILRAFKASTKLSSKAISSMLTEDNELDHEGETSVTTANLLCISAMTCLNKLVEQLGTFLGSSFLQKVLMVVFSIEEIFGHGTKSENRRKVFEQRLKALLKTVGTKIPLRSSIVTIKEVFIKLDGVEDYTSRSKSLLLLIGLLKETLSITPKSDFTTLLPSLCDVFLDQILLFREKTTAENDNVPTEKLDEVENSFLDCLVSGMVLKMSEGMFRPFYHKMFDWASDSLPRLITFFRLSTMAAERLKSLFVTFAGFVIHEGSKRLTEDATLTRSILSYFYQIFLHDKEGFVTIERFNALVKPLVDLVESEFLLGGKISINQLNETLIQLAVASNDLNRWQHMIDLLSLKTRHEDPKVRLFVISTIETAAAELGKDFLPLLPPAVPFLAEMMNDDDDEVEKETRKMLAKLEDLLGESLQPYFTV